MSDSNGSSGRRHWKQCRSLLRGKEESKRKQKLDIEPTWPSRIEGECIRDIGQVGHPDSGPDKSLLTPQQEEWHTGCLTDPAFRRARMRDPFKLVVIAHLRTLNFVWVLWIAFALQFTCAMAGIDLAYYLGLMPRSFQGVPGIVGMHFLHGSFPHILLNSISLFMVMVPLFLVFDDDIHMPETIFKIMVISGILLWVFGRKYGPEHEHMRHIGASALSYGLAMYTLSAGIVFRNGFLIMVAAANFFLSGGALIKGLDPTEVSVSWEGHLCGLVAGIIVAIGQKTQLSTKLPAEDI